MPGPARKKRRGKPGRAQGLFPAPRALDKAETIIQHNQGRNPEDFDYRFNLGYGKEYFEGSGFLHELRTLLDEETAAKLHGTD